MKMRKCSSAEIVNGTLLKHTGDDVEFTVPPEVCEIDEYAFAGSIYLKKISLPTTLENIRESAFKGCVSLEEVRFYIPEDGDTSADTEVTEVNCHGIIGEDSESHDPMEELLADSSVIETSLTDFFDGNVYDPYSPEEPSDDEDGDWYDEWCRDWCDVLDEGEVDSFDCMDDELPPYHAAGFSIGPMAFKNCTALKVIEFPDTYTFIHHRAFEGCISLESIDLPEKLIDVYDEAFKGCCSLKTVVLHEPEDKAIRPTFGGRRVFFGCPHLEDEGGFVIIENRLMEHHGEERHVRVPDGVSIIGDYAFTGEELESVSIPDTVTSIEEGAFEGCSSLKSFTVPKAVTRVKEYTFMGCSSLREVVLHEGVTEIGASAFERCTSLEEITLSEGISEIPRYAFSGCKALERITVPAGVRTVGREAFAECGSLIEVVLYEGVNKIENGAFRGCTALKRITFTSTLERIGDNAFYRCSDEIHSQIPESLKEGYVENMTTWVTDEETGAAIDLTLNSSLEPLTDGDDFDEDDCPF